MVGFSSFSSAVIVAFDPGVATTEGLFLLAEAGLGVVESFLLRSNFSMRSVQSRFSLGSHVLSSESYLRGGER